MMELIFLTEAIHNRGAPLMAERHGSAEPAATSDAGCCSGSDQRKWCIAANVATSHRGSVERSSWTDGL